MNPTVVHVVPSFHYDVAYTETFEDYLPRSFRCIEEGLRLLEAYPDFTFGIEQVILVREFWKRKPRARRALKRFAAEGRLFFAPGMFTMPDANLPSGESFIRNALLGRRWLRDHLGVVPDCCWMADIFGHPATMPGLAATCGFTSYLFERGKSGSWNTTFRWKGLDGSVLDTQWEIDTYFGLRIALAWRGNRPRDWVDARILEEIVDPLRRHSPCPELLMSPLGGDFHAPLEEDLRFLHDWNRRRRDVRFVFSTPARYFAALREHGVTPVTETSDQNPLFEGCYASRIRIKQHARALEETAGAVEAIETVSGSDHKTSEALWEVSSWNAFHDIVCGTLRNAAVKDALRQYRTSLRRGGGALIRMARKLGRSGRGAAPAYLNSLPYARREIVSGPDGPRRVEAPALGLAMPAAPRRITGRVRIGKGGRVLENARIRVTLGRNGTLAEIRDKANGLVLSGGGRGLGNPLLQPDYGDSWVVNEGPVNASLLRAAPRPDPVPASQSTLQRDERFNRRATDADCFAWPEPQVVCDHPLRATVAVSYPAIRLRQEISLCHDERLVRFRTTFLPSGHHYRLRMGFFNDLRNVRVRHAIPCGHVEGKTGEHPAQGWVEVADRRRGLLLVNRGLPGNSVVDGTVMLSLFRGVAFNKPDETPWYEEDVEQVFEYGILLFDPRDASHDPARLAARFNRPLVPVAGVGAPPDRTPPFLTLDGRAEMTCLRREGDDLVVRVWETAGTRSPVTLSFADPLPGQAIRTDAVGTPLKTLRTRGNTLVLTLKPFEIATVRIRMREPLLPARRV